MRDQKHLRPTKLLWVDLEMTGLDPDQYRIVEIAAKITDFEFRPLAEYAAVIYQPDEVLEQATAWNKEHHGGPDGLYARVRSEGKPEAVVMQDLVKLIHDSFGDEPAVMAGNSIHQDRRFIRKWWPEVDGLLHYRMLDVSSWKVVMSGKYGLEFVKKEDHRALGDIDESIAELHYYLSWFAEHNL